MIPYQKEKIDNAICFFASEHKKKTRKDLDQTSLYKYLAFFDFENFERIGKPALGLRYKAMQWGPVPIDIYSKRADLKTECYTFVKRVNDRSDKDKYIIIAHGQPDMDYFSENEVKEMRRLIEIYADRFVNASHMSEASHQGIKAWKKAWAKSPQSMIDYNLSFDKDPATKPENELTFAEENYLISKALESC